MARLVEKPVELYLYQEQFDALERLSAKEGKTIVDLILQGIDRLLAETPIEEDPLWDIVGIGRSETGDLALEHDRHLAEIEMADNH